MTTLKVTDIVYSGNGFVATFNNGDVASAYLVINDNGIIDFEGLTREQKTAVNTFNASNKTDDSLDLRFEDRGGGATIIPPTVINLGMVSGGINVNAANCTNSNISYVDAMLTGNVTIGNPLNATIDGQRITYRLMQDNAGGRSISLASVFSDPFSQMSNISTTPNSWTYIAVTYHEALAKWVVLAVISGII